MHSLRHREGKEETAPLVNQPMNWVILGNPWDGTSPCIMAFLNEKVILNIGGAWPGSCMLPFFCSFLWLHQEMPSTLSKPQSLTAGTGLLLERPKWSDLLSFWLKETSAPVLFSNLATESLLPFIFSRSYSTSHPQFHCYFFFPSTSSSQPKAILSLPPKNLSPALAAIHSVATV